MSERVQLLVGIGQIIAVAIIPIIIWVLGIKYQDRKSKKDAQLNVFLLLMKYRGISSRPQEFINALNIIDIVFHSKKKVRNAWKAYHNSLKENSPEHANKNTYFLELLSEMAETLGYRKMKLTEIEKGSAYTPKSIIKEREKKNKILDSLLNALENLNTYYSNESKNENNSK